MKQAYYLHGRPSAGNFIRLLWEKLDKSQLTDAELAWLADPFDHMDAVAVAFMSMSQKALDYDIARSNSLKEPVDLTGEVMNEIHAMFEAAYEAGRLHEQRKQAVQYDHSK